MGGGKHQDGRAGGRAEATPTAADVERLVHELEVGRVELELQNEELRAARVEIEAGLARYTELFDVAPVAYFVLGPDGGILDLNWAASRLVGVERRVLVGRRLAAYLEREDQPTLGRLVADVLLDVDRGRAPGRACELVRLPRPSGAVDVRICVAPLPAQGDAVLVAGEDVTAQRAAEDALREESRRKDDFLAALSHELRNPLAPIRNGLSLLSQAPAGSEQAVRALHVVERQVAHLSQIVDDLLDVTRIARGKIRLHRQPVELGELVRRTVEDHRATFDHAGVALDARLARDPCWVLADATRVAQIVGNLLGNAAKFTAPGGRVEVTVRREAEVAAVRIADTGVGIAPEVQERLFEPFNQAPQSLDRTRGGLGLGLATVKGLVELHGGSVALSSAGEGRGAEFTVRLPLTAAPAAAREAAPPSRRERRRVLVVDDNEDAATTLQELLALSGHEVRVALDGPQGVAVAREFLPDVVICDIGLPGMDGYAVARALRAAPATHAAYLVALTGYALPDDCRRAADAGFDRHLAKPLGVDTLERALAEAPGEPPRPRGAAQSPEAGGATGP